MRYLSYLDFYGSHEADSGSLSIPTDVGYGRRWLPSLFAQDTAAIAADTARKKMYADEWDALVKDLKPETQASLKAHPDLMKHLQGEVQAQFNDMQNTIDNAKGNLKQQIDTLGEKWRKDPAALRAAQDEIKGDRIDDPALAKVKAAEEAPVTDPAVKKLEKEAQKLEDAPAAIKKEAQEKDAAAKTPDTAAAPDAQAPSASSASDAASADKDTKLAGDAPSAMEAAKKAASGLAPRALGAPGAPVVSGATVSEASEAPAGAASPEVMGQGSEKLSAPKPSIAPMLLQLPPFPAKGSRHRKAYEAAVLASFL